MGPDSLYCGKKKEKSPAVTLTLAWEMPNMELVQDIFMSYTVMQFHVPRLLFELSCKNTETHTNTHDSDKYSIVAFCKNANIIKQSIS